MDLFLGGEKNIFQNEVLGVEMVEIDEMFLYKQLQT
jgi:hypothetical protein